MGEHVKTNTAHSSGRAFVPLSYAGRAYTAHQSFSSRQERSSARLFVSADMDEETRYGRILGLKGKVTRDEIKSAYRAQANLYHPDRVAHLGPEFQELANEKMKELNRAFSYFQKKYHF
ncbi:MAG: J domain-containing protein [Acidobacteriota bacterium]